MKEEQPQRQENQKTITNTEEEEPFVVQKIAEFKGKGNCKKATEFSNFGKLSFDSTCVQFRKEKLLREKMSSKIRAERTQPGLQSFETDKRQMHKQFLDRRYSYLQVFLVHILKLPDSKK